MAVIGVIRDRQYSPCSEEKDLAILKSVVDKLGGQLIEEADLPACQELSGKGNIFLNMGRMPETIGFLKQKEDEGAMVINSAYGVEKCQRSRLEQLMREKHIPMPRRIGRDGWWVKRGDAAAQTPVDVVFCPTEATLEAAKQQFLSRGIDDIVIQAHVPGDVVKFYGVEGTSFFKYYYPGDDGESKFGDERHNGKPHHYFFQKEHLRATVEMLARLIQIPVYGGDAIITPEGEFKIIDFNDWPSFSRCREEAAHAIVQYVMLNR